MLRAQLGEAREKLGWLEGERGRLLRERKSLSADLDAHSAAVARLQQGVASDTTAAAALKAEVTRVEAVALAHARDGTTLRAELDRVMDEYGRCERGKVAAEAKLGALELELVEGKWGGGRSAQAAHM